MSLSIDSAIRTVKVGGNLGNVLMSERYINPEAMICPVWSGKDVMGRSVLASTFKTKSAGCNSASDIIRIENNIRPTHSEKPSLNIHALKGDNVYTNKKLVDYKKSFDSHPYETAMALQRQKSEPVKEDFIYNQYKRKINM